MTLTIFTAPKPFTNPHINTIQRNALESWLQLGPQVDVIVLGDEAGMAEVARAYGVRHIPEVRVSSYGTPLISSIFELAHQATDNRLLAYVNADILVFSDFVKTALQVEEQAEKFLIIGQRWDLDVTERLDISAGWEDRLLERVKKDGKLHVPRGSDYFIFPSQCFTHIPDFAVGRSMWDNWMIYHALKSNWATVDATHSATVIHQNHDYSHLPGGLPHYRQPETQVNIRLAGGRRRAMYINDANSRLVNGKLVPIPMNWQRLMRSIEVFPILQMDSIFLARIFFAIFHPRRALRKTRRWLKGQIVWLLRR
jgi:hypothetical protein